MSLEILIIICLVVIIALIIAFINIRDKEINRRLEIFGKTIEDINHQNFELKNMVKEKMFQNTLEGNKELNDMLEKEVQSKIQPLQNSLREVEEITRTFGAKQKEYMEQNFGSFEQTKENLSQNIEYPTKQTDEVVEGWTLTQQEPQDSVSKDPSDIFEDVKEDGIIKSQREDLEQDDFDYEKRICDLFDSGKNEAQIAELLNLKESEVAFVLSLNSKR